MLAAGADSLLQYKKSQSLDNKNNTTRVQYQSLYQTDSIQYLVNKNVPDFCY